MKAPTRILRVASWLLLGLFFAACATPRHAATVAWTRDSIVGLRIELTDPVRLESMSFSPEGYVPITFGEKNGEIAFPLLKWKLVNGRLRIFDSDGIYDELRLISRDASSVVARRRSGEIAKYEIVERPDAEQR